MTRFVVDASVAVKWLVEEEDSAAADRLLEPRHELFAPRLMASEVGNALWRKVRMGELERSRAGVMAAAISEMAVRWMADEDTGPDAVRLSLALDHPVYDCVYLALAHRIGATLVTADARFANSLAETEHSSGVVTLKTLQE